MKLNNYITVWSTPTKGCVERDWSHPWSRSKPKLKEKHRFTVNPMGWDYKSASIFGIVSCGQTKPARLVEKTILYYAYASSLKNGDDLNEFILICSASLISTNIRMRGTRSVRTLLPWQIEAGLLPAMKLLISQRYGPVTQPTTYWGVIYNNSRSSGTRSTSKTKSNNHTTLYYMGNHKGGSRTNNGSNCTTLSLLVHGELFKYMDNQSPLHNISLQGGQQQCG